MVISGLQSGLQGLQRAERRLDQVASNVASAFQLSLSPEARSGVAPDLVQETVASISAVAAYRANLKSIQTDDELSGVLISLGR